MGTLAAPLLDFELFAGLAVKVNGRGRTPEEEFHPSHKLFVYTHLGYC